VAEERNREQGAVVPAVVYIAFPPSRGTGSETDLKNHQETLQF